MGKNLYEKIWANHCIKRYPRENEDLIFIDLHLLHEINTPQSFDSLKKKKRVVRHPELTLATVDHNTPTKSIKSLVNDTKRNKQVVTLRKNCEKNNIKFNDLGDENQGIVHVMAPEQGLVIPGSTLVCCDSHTTTHGAFGCLAVGIGSSQVEHVLTTQTLRLPKFKTMKVNVENQLSQQVSAKDLALYIINEIGTDGGFGYIIEYTGETIENLTMEERMTLCNMAVEAGAAASLIGVDKTTIEYLKKIYNNLPSDELQKRIEYWETWKSDIDAKYDKVINFNASNVNEMVTWGTNPSQSITFAEKVPHAYDDLEIQKSLQYMQLKPGQKLKDIKIDVVFIGSCTNGRIEDLREVARLLKNKKVSPSVKMIIVPGSMRVRKQAVEEGLDKIFNESGADFRLFSGCSMCVGLSEDTLKQGTRCISTSNRNFEGRQGIGVLTHIASPSVATASAVNGYISSSLDI